MIKNASLEILSKSNGLSFDQLKVHRSAVARWKSDFKNGDIVLKETGDISEHLKSDFERGFTGGNWLTNPEELLAAAYASGFACYVAGLLNSRGFSRTSLDAEVTLSIHGKNIYSAHLALTGVVRGITADNFFAVVKDATKNCPISQLLHVPITSEAVLSLRLGHL